MAVEPGAARAPPWDGKRGKCRYFEKKTSKTNAQDGRQRRSITDYRRMTFSDGVSASMYAGREKMRSAYFISGAAVFDNSIP